MTYNGNRDPHDRSKQGYNLPSTTGNPSGGDRDNLPPRASQKMNHQPNDDETLTVPVSFDGDVFDPRDARVLLDDEGLHRGETDLDAQIAGHYCIRLDDGTIKHTSSVLEACDQLRKTPRAWWFTSSVDRTDPFSNDTGRIMEWVEVDSSREMNVTVGWLKSRRDDGIEHCKAEWRRQEDDAIHMATDPMP